tara:strand:+ start:1518 stop:1718 length:201 start_codon:yes stop_codon:yes gene_type:complete
MRPLKEINDTIRDASRRLPSWGWSTWGLFLYIGLSFGVTGLRILNDIASDATHVVWLVAYAGLFVR